MVLSIILTFLIYSNFLLLNRSCFWLFVNTAHVLDIVKDKENHS